jgi:transposase InsO family protein
VPRRTGQGLTKKDIIRCLKRFVAREIYNALIKDHQARHADIGRVTGLTTALLTHRAVNALAESVIGLFKTEVIRRLGPWRGLEEAVEFETLAWVDWFNMRRLLEPIGYVPPAEYEAQYYQQAAVACQPTRSRRNPIRLNL